VITRPTRLEYLAQFRDDLEEYVSRAAVEACISRGVFERPWVYGTTHFIPLDVNQKIEEKAVVRYETVEERRAAMIAKGWSPTVLAALEEAMEPKLEEAMEPKFLRDMREESMREERMREESMREERMREESMREESMREEDEGQGEAN
jgi:hypothetical protein